MALLPTQQVRAALDRTTNVLVALPAVPTTDAVAAGLALSLVLQKLGRTPRVVSSDWRTRPSHRFLPGSTEIASELVGLSQFVVSLDLSRAAVDTISYAVVADRLDVFITPKRGAFRPADVSTTSGDYAYQLICTIGAPDYESLGAIFERHPEFFYHTPVINIDHRAENEHFGQINLVDLTATATSELVFELARDLDPSLIDEHVATCLLTGIISQTRSFQTTTVTPRALAAASHLVAAGARRDEIVKHLYQTKTVAALRLFGRVCSALATERDGRIVTAVISADDLAATGADEGAIDGVLDELTASLPAARVVAVLVAGREHTDVWLTTAPTVNLIPHLAEFNPTGTANRTHCTIPSAAGAVRTRLLTALGRAVPLS